MQSDRIKSWPADERPREKLLAHGAENLSPAELLAVVLRVGQGTFKKGVPGQNATAFAQVRFRLRWLLNLQKIKKTDDGWALA